MTPAGEPYSLTPSGCESYFGIAARTIYNWVNNGVRKWKAIQYTLESGTFDYLKFLPTGSKAKHFKPELSGITFAEFWEIWWLELLVSNSY